jgi:hypothetical protein
MFVLSGTDSSQLCLLWVVLIRLNYVFLVIQIRLDYVFFNWDDSVSIMFVWSGTDSSRLRLFGVVPIHLDYVCLEWYRFVSTMFVWSGTDSSRLCLFGVVPIRLHYVFFVWYRFVSPMFYFMQSLYCSDKLLLFLPLITWMFGLFEVKLLVPSTYRVWNEFEKNNNNIFCCE